jgi:membrane protein YdbS with pleckstrin-like domain
MIYSSKKDSWLVVIVSAAILIPILIGIYNLFAPSGNLSMGWGMLLAGAFTGAVVLCSSYPLYYEITPTELKIRCGMLIRQQIPLSAIEEVYKTSNPLSAPAWSLDRLRINYRQKGAGSYTLISPADKEGFLRELVKSGKGLERRGGRVVRAS